MSKSEHNTTGRMPKTKEKSKTDFLLLAIIFAAALITKLPKPPTDISASTNSAVICSAAESFEISTTDISVKNISKQSAKTAHTHNPLCGHSSFSQSGNFLTAQRKNISVSSVNSVAKILDKIWFIESSRRLNPPAGRGGLAVGPMQLKLCVLQDVNKFYGKNFKDADRYDLKKAQQIATLYMAMWLELNAEELAVRIYHGGPKGWKSSETDLYYKKYLATEASEK